MSTTIVTTTDLYDVPSAKIASPQADVRASTGEPSVHYELVATWSAEARPTATWSVQARPTSAL